jgi:membrane protein YdbS with pleckstrin-like domain
MSNNNSSSSGIGFTGLLTIVFVIFKILGYIKWSWWWVFSPIWISISILVVILFFCLAIWILSELLPRSRR